jgi:hypothetical protein
VRYPGCKPAYTRLRIQTCSKQTICPATSPTDAEVSPFAFGSAWVRADFHLHTKADKEFHYAGAENDFIGEYVERLNKAQIGLGVITNHNKFNADEFKAAKTSTQRRHRTFAECRIVAITPDLRLELRGSGQLTNPRQGLELAALIARVSMKREMYLAAQEAEREAQPVQRRSLESSPSQG